MNEVQRALSEIAEIRAQMTAGSRFRGFAPQAMSFGAALALAVAMAQTLWPQALAADAPRFVLVWGVALIVSSVVGGLAAVSRARCVHGPMAAAMLGATLRQLLPFAAAAAAIALVLCLAWPASGWLVPGLWLMLIGLAGFATALRLPPAIVWPSAWFLACGAAALAQAARGAGLSPWAMAWPLAAGQAAVALILHHHKEAADAIR